MLFFVVAKKFKPESRCKDWRGERADCCAVSVHVARDHLVGDDDVGDDDDDDDDDEVGNDGRDVGALHSIRRSERLKRRLASIDTSIDCQTRATAFPIAETR